MRLSIIPPAVSTSVQELIDEEVPCVLLTDDRRIDLASVVLAISSSNRDPLNAMAHLYDRSNSSKLHSSRPYMDPTVLRFFVVMHDNTEGTDLEECV